jgi:hypothetical protein
VTRMPRMATWVRELGRVEGWEGEALFSPDHQYRYHLSRSRPGPARELVVIGLNPSSAGAAANDATTRRCLGFAVREGCSVLRIVNLFGYVATNPVSLPAGDLARAVGPGCDEQVLAACGPPPTGWERQVVAAWGSHASDRRLRPRVTEVLALLEALGVRLEAFGVTRAGFPLHPLYLPADAPLRHVVMSPGTGRVIQVDGIDVPGEFWWPADEPGGVQ